METQEILQYLGFAVLILFFGFTIYYFFFNDSTGNENDKLFFSFLKIISFPTGAFIVNYLITEYYSEGFSRYFEIKDASGNVKKISDQMYFDLKKKNNFLNGFVGNLMPNFFTEHSNLNLLINLFLMSSFFFLYYNNFFESLKNFSLTSISENFFNFKYFSESVLGLIIVFFGLFKFFNLSYQNFIENLIGTKNGFKSDMENMFRKYESKGIGMLFRPKFLENSNVFQNENNCMGIDSFFFEWISLIKKIGVIKDADGNKRIAPDLSVEKIRTLDETKYLTHFQKEVIEALVNSFNDFKNIYLEDPEFRD